jgi:endothelin-converting enzyme/putative endopeptidase
MRNLSILLLIPLLSAVCAAAETPGANGFSTASMDTKVDPCTDFYRYACGGWLAKNPVPADQPSWGRFNELIERNRALLRNILEKASDPAAKRTPDEVKLGEFYSSCMDEKGVEALGASPMKPHLDGIAAMKTSADLPGEISRLFAGGFSTFFSLSSTQDYKDATSVIADLDQAGLGLPEKDYYLRTDASSAEMRDKYLAHMRRMFALAGYDAAASSAAASSVMRFETMLAQASMGKVERRVPENTYHKMTAQELAALAPAIDWAGLFAAAGAPGIRVVNVDSPDFIRKTGEMIKTVPLEDWKNYFAWNVIRQSAPLLSKAFVDENFDFYGRTLGGAKELKPRWKRCVRFTDNALGDLTGKAFVERAFSPAAKTAAIEMVKNIEKALGSDIGGQDWMSPKTRVLAAKKLAAIENKMGYPDKWRNYSGLEVRHGDWFGNSARADLFELHRQLGKIGKPVDRGDWDMTAPTVNAYYHPTLNTINFPAGILQPPFFDAALDPAVNYGAIGGVIAHELTHGFDDQGRKFDGDGNMNEWWTETDAKEYEKRSECFVKEYSSFTVAGNLPVNGKLTLGENTADNGGLRLALMALNGDSVIKPAKPIDGFTQEQRVFLGWAQVWCENTSDAAIRMQVLTDPHPPSENRVNGVVINMPEFAKAFGCAKGSPMTTEHPCRLW